VAEEVIGEKTIRDYTKHTRWLERLLDGTEASLGAALAKGLGLDGTVGWK
jgi:protease-4